MTASRIAPACGSDTSFYLFRQFEGHWVRFYVYERAPYEKDEDGREAFEYVLSPKLPDGSSYLGFVYQAPWCTSCWSGLNYEVRQLSLGGEVGAPMLVGDESFRRCADEEVEDIRPYLSVDAKGITFRFITSSFDTGILMRRRVDRYLFKDGGLERVPSSGMAAGATLEHWLDLPWEEARNWVDGAKPERLATWHTRLAKVNAQDDERLSLEYEYVMPPKRRKHSWQICLSAEDANSPWKSKRGLVTLVERKGIFRIQQVKEGCPPHKGKL